MYYAPNPPQRVLTQANSTDIPDEAATEMLQVGMVASPYHIPVGQKGYIGPFLVEITGYGTRDEFLQAIAQANIPGLTVEGFAQLPEGLYYPRIRLTPNFN